jgi:hypothetical protein
MVKQALHNHSFSMPIFNTGSTGITRGWLHQGGLMVNEFACPCSLPSPSSLPLPIIALVAVILLVLVVYVVVLVMVSGWE